MLKNDSLEQLHADLEAAHMAPTWKYIADFVSREPRKSYRPWLWKWDDVIPLLMRAGDLVTPERGAERRSMEHVNPDLGFSYSASHTLATAVQLVRAGERAPAHRHMAAAIRFAAKSRGGAVYTQVQGEKLRMEENDLILTPSWSWHEHANETEHDIVWLDALDFPLVNLMQASIFEPGETGPVPERPSDFSERRLSNFRPTGWGEYPDPFPVLRYPWREMHAALVAEREADGSPFDGVIMEYVNPTDSGPTLPTMSCRAQLLRRGEATLAHRSSSSTIYYVISGSGSTVIDGTRFEWGSGDVFVIPNWMWHEHVNGGEESFLFSVTDEPVMRRLGMYREQALAENEGRQTVTGTFVG
ncbi:MAG: cupin domain-containing protein [Rhizobiaceae bacterium]